MLTEEAIGKSPEDTLRDVKPILDEAGVTRIADITGMDRIGIPVYAAIRPDSKSLAVDSGKGITKAQAKCSAAMEAIERWAHDEASRGFDDEPHGYVPHNFPMVRGAVLDKDFSHHRWYRAHYYNNGESVSVPYYHVYNYEKRLPLHKMPWQSGTNGLAAGNTRNEAILQGVYEIIERDAATIWMVNSFTTGNGKRIDNDHIIPPICRDMVEMCEDAGVCVCLYNATSDIDIPVYVCLLIDRRDNIGVYKGYGCNLDQDIAMQRAICEAAQGRAVFLSGGRDDMRWKRHLYESKKISNQQTLRELDADIKHGIPHKNHTGLNLSDEDKISMLDEVLVNHGCGHIIVADIMNREHAYVVKVMSEHLEGYWNPYLQLGKRTR